MLHSQPHSFSHSLLDPQTARILLYFAPQKLVALGIPPIEADSIAKLLSTKHIARRYCRKLTEAGVPKENARRIARAIAKYDVDRVLPNSRQQKLIRYYCPIVCRCGLWRSALLLP